MATNLPTDIDATYPDRSPGDKLHQQMHDTTNAYTNEHDSAPDPHGDRAYADGKFLTATGKAADAEKLDGLDSTDFSRLGAVSTTTTGVVQNTYNIDKGTCNARMASGLYNGSAVTGAPITTWVFIQVMCHVFGANTYQRQLCYEMAGDRIWSRRCSGGDPALAASWTAWTLLH